MNLVLADSAPSTAQLQSVLQLLLNRENRAERPLVHLVRRPSAYRSSYALEELEIVRADGTRLNLMFKDLSPARLSLDARRAKPPCLCNPLREIELYRTLLAEHELGTARLYGYTASEKQGQ